MEIRRTANAGVLLSLDDEQILLDGVCREVAPYLATPPAEKQKLLTTCPDGVLFTHTHDDHFDAGYARDYTRKTGNPVCFPDGTEKSFSLGAVQITALPTRHMGRAGLTETHQSFVLRGSRCVWFLGDASPSELRKFSAFPKADVLMVPYPYISTPAALRLVENLRPCKIAVLHLPDREHDPEGLWQTILPGLERLKAYICVPPMGQTLKIESTP